MNEGMLAEPRQRLLELASPQLPIWLELKSFADRASFQLGGYTRFAGRIDLALGRQAVELGNALQIILSHNELPALSATLPGLTAVPVPSIAASPAGPSRSSSTTSPIAG